MNRDLFLRELRNELIVLDFNEQEEIINEYLYLFEVKNDEGLSDEQIIKELGKPKEIARQFLDEFNIDNDKIARITQANIRPTRQLGLFVFVIIFDVLIGFWLFVALMALLSGLILLGVAMIIAGPIIIISHYQTTWIEVLAVLSLVIGFALLLLSGSVLLIRLVVLGAIKHLNWLKSLL